LNHSITIIGWGIDKESGTKYWIIGKSYGPNWGDKGDFLMERGVNFAALEAEATYYEPVLCSETQC